MKVLVLILLLGNLLFLSAIQWGWPSLSGEPPARALPPLHEEKISLLEAPPEKPPTAANSAPAPAPVPPGDNALCMEWGEFSGSDLERASAALSALQLGEKSSSREVEYDKGYWVYIPPQKDKTAVNQKIAQIKARGISEYFVVPDAGPWHNAISLGVFRTQEAAQHFLDELRRNKDVRSAQIGERASKLKTRVFVLTGLDEKTAAAIGAMQPNFPGSELKNIDCATP